jgi:hypothetical protein
MTTGTILGELGQKARGTQEVRYPRELEEAAAVGQWETLRAGYSNRALSAALYLGRNYSDKTLRELGELAGGMQYPTVTMAVRRFAKRLETDATLASKVKRLQAMLLVKT